MKFAALLFLLPLNAADTNTASTTAAPPATQPLMNFETLTPNPPALADQEEKSTADELFDFPISRSVGIDVEKMLRPDLIYSFGPLTLTR